MMESFNNFIALFWCELVCVFVVVLKRKSIVIEIRVRGGMKAQK